MMWLRGYTLLLLIVKGKHQAASAYSGETLYIGQKSRRISLKLHNKYKELQKHNQTFLVGHMARRSTSTLAPRTKT
ncbi:phage/plasmid replication domain-containing protein [Candidatus Reidiella endopervernicosa]|uniref:Replication-associated protein G2P N-terminal domain-containing protein n=1 Tax=Candidatus Reidiella endopervernicosa TaxID=2738883 RepID=A0A6N0HVM9_9GAMM|nr:hypothetical protein HUE57_09320 [Candidatus Reidiella endopervernicosa]